MINDNKEVDTVINKGRQWPINWCTTSMMIKNTPSVDYNSNYTQVNEPQ